jgi:hypothetical protein
VKTTKQTPFSRQTLPLLATSAALMSGVTLLASAAETAPPTPNVPFVQGNAPTLDGTLGPGEWKNALLLTALGEPGSPQTRFWVQHDGTALWVAVEGAESRQNRPTAQPRGPEANLSIDDAVEVALGLPGGGARSITMGGYEGAMAGQVAPMAHLYEFVVNAAGSTARRYNEMALPSAKFTAKTGRTKTGWQTEMRIPFASMGLEKPAGQELFANFVRFLPPQKVAWKGMHRWGGYSPFPTSRLRLAATPDEPRVNDTPVPQPAPIDAPTPEPKNPNLRFFPISNSICADVKVKPGGTAILTAAGITKSEVSAKGGVIRLVLDLPKHLTVGENFTAELETRTANGQTDFTHKQTFTGTDTPKWAGTDAGIKYLNDAVPTPWQPPVVQGQSVKLTSADITFADSGLPGSIKNASGELLAAPIAIELAAGGKPLPIRWDKVTLSTTGIRPVIHSSGLFGTSKIEVRTEVDFDGFMTVQVRFDGKPRNLDSVKVTASLPHEKARYFTQRSVQNITRLDAGGFKGVDAGRYGGRCWMGSENGGLTFSTDLPFYKAAERYGEIAVEDRGPARTLVLTSIDRAAQLTPDTVLQFYIHATPTRPQAKVTMDDYHLWFEQWSDHQGYPDLKKIPDVIKYEKMKNEIGYMGRNDLPLILYFNQLLAEDTPEFKLYRDELIAPPDRMWYQRAYDGPGKGVSSYVCCVRGPYGDLLLDGIRTLAKEANIGGVYMDGTTVNWDCDNPAHAGCNENRLPVWNQPGETRVLSTRAFLKRLRGIFAERGKPFYMVAHTGGDLDSTTLSLVDQFWEGEQLARYLPGYRIPQEEFAVGYSGAPWGYRTLFFDRTWLGQRGENWSFIYDLLYNSDNQRDGVRVLLRPFEVPGASFHPYWKDGQKLLQKSKTGETFVSYYTAPAGTTAAGTTTASTERGVLVAATSFSFGPDEIELNVAAFPEYKDTEWVDLYTATTYRAENGIIRLGIPSKQGVALRPASQSPVAPFVSTVTPSTPDILQVQGMNPAQWVVNTQKDGPKRTDIAATGDSAPWILLGSETGKPPVNGSIPGLNIYHDAELTFKFKAQGRAVLQLDMGPLEIVHDAGQWQIRGPVDGWNDNNLQQIPWANDQEIEMRISWHAQQLTVTINDQVLVDRMQIKLINVAPRPLRIWTAPGESIAFQSVSIDLTPSATSNLTVQHPVAP